MPEFAACREDMRAFNITQGLTKVEYVTEANALVEHGRDALLAHAMNPNPQTKSPPYAWCLQVDADATFPADALLRILHTAFIKVPDADVVGAYAQLKGGAFICTIDTGTGTWEPHFPGEGVLPVIRTGAHFLLVKTPILTRFGPPWFRTRLAFRPIDALREVDNFARIRLAGRNPFSETEEWQKLLEDAKAQGGGTESPVGEDSGFSDSVKAAGGNIYVDTDLVTGHIAKKVITPEDLKKAMDTRERRLRAAVGITS